MFLEFFYFLRSNGLQVSTQEWLDFLHTLEMGLHDSTMKGFYVLCRAVVCKSEEEYDLFDESFVQYFQDAFFYANGEVREEISEQMKEWLNNPGASPVPSKSEEDVPDIMKDFDQKEIEKRFKEQLEDQKEEHNEGYHYIGTQGVSPFGNAGFNPNGIRAEGISVEHRAIRVAGQRKFRDFRKDNTLSIRQYQMAFRILRRYSNDNDYEQELDIDRTIQDTCNKGGLLQVCYQKPRKNNIQVLFLMDSGGTMSPYQQLCSRLFQAVSQSNHFKNLKIYYFHNCPHEVLYSSPTLEEQYEVPTEEVLMQCPPRYKVIFVGDAYMEMGELNYHPLYVTRQNRGYCGLEWLREFKKRYKDIVWLNPMMDQESNSFISGGDTSFQAIRELFAMYPLTVAGLERGMKHLMGAGDAGFGNFNTKGIWK